MSWGEALRLTQMLVTDPGSQVGATVSGWAHPADRFTLALYDLYDLQHHGWAAGSKQKPKPYPRPWPSTGKRTTKPDESLTQAEIVAALEFAGHTAPIPT